MWSYHSGTGYPLHQRVCISFREHLHQESHNTYWSFNHVAVAETLKHLATGIWICVPGYWLLEVCQTVQRGQWLVMCLRWSNMVSDSSCAAIPISCSLHLSQFIPHRQPAVDPADHASIKTIQFDRRVAIFVNPYVKPSCLGPSWIMIYKQNHQNSLDIWWDDLGLFKTPAINNQKCRFFCRVGAQND